MRRLFENGETSMGRLKSFNKDGLGFAEYIGHWLLRNIGFDEIEKSLLKFALVLWRKS